MTDTPNTEAAFEHQLRDVIEKAIEMVAAVREAEEKGECLAEAVTEWLKKGGSGEGGEASQKKVKAEEVKQDDEEEEGD